MFMRKDVCDPVHDDDPEPYGHWQLPYVNGNHDGAYGLIYLADMYVSQHSPHLQNLKKTNGQVYI